MRKVPKVGAVAIGATVAAAMWLPAGPSAAAPTPTAPEQAIAQAQQAIATHPVEVHAAAADAYTAVGTTVDAFGASHVRYQRTYGGLPVLGGDFIVHNNADGSTAGITAAQSQAITVSTHPSRSAAQAAATARTAFAGQLTSVGRPRLIVDAQLGTPALAYETVLGGWQPDGQTPSRLHVLTDATTGAVLGSFDEIQDVTGTGDSLFSGQVAIDTTATGSTFEMVDPAHGGDRTCDLNNTTRGACTTFTDADNAWGNGTNSDRATAGVDAHFGAATTFDYYRNVLGRDGIFDNGTGVPSRVHYGRNYVNAFWDGSQMTYGDGENNAHPLVEIDVAGHEMSHGVTENTANLNYFGEPGGLNEGTSDIFGNMVEFYANTPADPGDYEVGELIDINGDGTPLRYMYQPSLDGTSPDCWSPSIGNLDVHYSSGIANKTYFMLAEGSSGSGYGTAPTCGAPAVTGVGRDAAAQIWYRALSVYWTSSTGYVSAGSNDARAGTLSAASDLYGECSTEYKAVQAAWTASNVAGEDQACTASDTYTNDTVVAIPDHGPAVTSPIAVDRAGNAPANLEVSANITHTARGDLVIDLIAPDGTAYRLKNRLTGDTRNNLIASTTVDVSSESAAGTWKLQVRDAFTGNTGQLNSWSLTF